MSSKNNNKCPHLDNILPLSSLSELCIKKQGCPCSECEANGPNLWICLHKNCLHTGCSEQYNDHSTKHFHIQQAHCIHMNLSSQRIWCYLCEAEVFFNNRRNSIISNESSDNSQYSTEKVMIYDRAGGGEYFESSGDEDDSDRSNMGGLVGLQNIANTCYMNAALQALSNTPALTGYFIDCGSIVEASGELMPNQRKFGLAKSYHRLIKEMWSKNRRSYLVPGGILSGIRNVHPMFRGYQQHDTQEFLRCFMDQLHEELKEITPPPPEMLIRHNTDNIFFLDHDDNDSPCSSPSPSQSEAEYETCNSGTSEQSSLSDEGFISIRQNKFCRSASPTSNQRNHLKQTQQQMTNPATGTTTSTSSNRTTTTTTGTGSTLSSQATQKNQRDPLSKLPHRSIISDVFDGKLLSSVQCLTCDRISTREEIFQDLSLPIPGKDHLAVIHQNQGITIQPSGVTCTDAVYQAGQDGWFWWLWNLIRSFLWGPAVSLHDCMAAFFSADELKGDNMYSCEKCNKLRNGIKFSRVLALPEMLCVHLKRFRHDLSYSLKISSPVRFPLSALDMRPYLHKDCKSEISLYDLTSVICHHGTVGGGHYTSYAKHEPTGKWFEYDDQLVTEVTPETVESCEAYVLFYRKTNPQMSILRSQALQLIDRNLQQSSDIKFFVSRQWLNKFNTFAEPGPIDNWALLCPHGGLPPCKAAVVSRLVATLPQPLWDFLYNKFGGGPACNHLFECDTCRRAAETLSNRQQTELNAFAVYNDEFQLQDNPTTIYAISMAWFRQWQLFARGVITEEPGPINNNGIAVPSDTLPIRSVRPGSDYAQINTTLWKFFYGLYGGGPEILLRGGPNIIDDKTNNKLEKEPEQEMEIDEKEIIKIKENKQTVRIPTQQQQTNVVVPQTQQPTQLINQNTVTKVTKNVSFEDVEVNSVDIQPTVVTSSPSQIPEFIIPNLKRTKQTNFQTKQTTELLKKDKRYRGMKTSGLFGVEGKYSDFKSQVSNIDEQNSFNYSTTNNHNNSSIPLTTNNNLNDNNLTTTTKKLDEIMPLLHQSTINIPTTITATQIIAIPASNTTATNITTTTTTTVPVSTTDVEIITNNHHQRKNERNNQQNYNGTTTTTNGRNNRKKLKSKSLRKAVIVQQYADNSDSG